MTTDSSLSCMSDFSLSWYFILFGIVLPIFCCLGLAGLFLFCFARRKKVKYYKEKVIEIKDKKDKKTVEKKPVEKPVIKEPRDET